MATAAAASATALPRLVEKNNSKIRVLKYFAFEADDQGLIRSAKTYMQTVSLCFLKKRRKHFQLIEVPQRQTSRFIQRFQVDLS